MGESESAKIMLAICGVGLTKFCAACELYVLSFRSSVDEVLHCSEIGVFLDCDTVPSANEKERHIGSQLDTLR